MTNFILGAIFCFLVLVVLSQLPRKRNPQDFLVISGTPDIQEKLKWLLKISGYKDMSEVTQMAYGLLNLAWNEYVKGGTVLIRSSDGTEKIINLKASKTND